MRFGTRLIVTLIFSMPWLVSANVVGVDAQNFNPTTNGLDFVTVQSSKTLSPGVLNFGLFFNYAVNTLPSYDNTNSPGSRTNPTDALTSMDLNMGFGIMNNWDVGISLPQVLNQTVDETAGGYRGQFENTGINEIRLNSKYRVWDGMSQGVALIGTVNWFMIEDYPLTGNDPGPTFNIEAAYDRTFSNFTLGVNVGYRFRNEGSQVQPPPGGDPLPAPFPNQYLASAAMSYYFADWDFKLIGEVYSSFPAAQVQTFSDRDISSAEALIGGKYDITTQIALHAGVATELFQGTSSPDYRVYAGINWALGPLFASNETPPQSDYFMEETEVYEDKSFTYIDSPEAFAAPAPTQDETFLAKNILFEFNGSKVNPQFHEYLKNLSEYLLKGNVFTELVIIGHTDSVGSDGYNLHLSMRRAEAVKGVIQSYLPPEHRGKIRAEGEGERSPIASNRNYQGRALNRRVEFFIKRQDAAKEVVTPASDKGPASVKKKKK